MKILFFILISFSSFCQLPDKESEIMTFFNNRLKILVSNKVSMVDWDTLICSGNKQLTLKTKTLYEFLELTYFDDDRNDREAYHYLISGKVFNEAHFLKFFTFYMYFSDSCKNEIHISKNELKIIYSIWKDHVKNGLERKYLIKDEDTLLYYTGNWKNGKKSGDWIYFYQNHPETIYTYKDDDLVYYQSFYPNGALKQEGASKGILQYTRNQEKTDPETMKFEDVWSYYHCYRGKCKKVKTPEYLEEINLTLDYPVYWWPKRIGNWFFYDEDGTVGDVINYGR